MVRPCTRSTLYSRSCTEHGFTLLELLVAAALGLLITALALSTTLATRSVLGRDTVRTRLNQDLRGSLDVMGADIREAGENLASSFPAVEITDGANGDPDTLTVRRNLLAEVLTLCQDITSGSTNTQVVYATSGSVSGCVLSGQDHNYNVWKSYRTSNQGAVKAFIYDTAAKTGEFFTYGDETRSYTQYALVRTGGGSWGHTYPAGSSAIYILEEWQYSLSGEMLKVTQDRDPSSAYNVAFDVTDFQVRALMQDGTTKTSFSSADAWNTIQTLELSLSGKDTYAGDQLSRTATVRFAPRNVLSN